MLSWIFIVLAHWNNSLWIDVSLHLDTLFWFRANQSYSFSLMFDTYQFYSFGFIWLGLKSGIYCTRVKHPKHYTTNVHKIGKLSKLKTKYIYIWYDISCDSIVYRYSKLNLDNETWTHQLELGWVKVTNLQPNTMYKVF